MRSISTIVLVVVLLASFDLRASQGQERGIQLDQLTEYGFTPTPYEGLEGINYIYNGHGFRLFVPEDLFKRLTVKSSISSVERKHQWMVYGNLPSPRSRWDGGNYQTGDDAGLNYSVRAVNDSSYVSFSCFQCHAGMVAGMTVAGLGNAHLDQTSLAQHLAEYAGIRDFYTKNIRGGIAEGLVDFLIGIDGEKKKHLMNFSLYSETVLLPIIKRAKTRGDDYGPYPVWQLIARLDNPAVNGFKLHAIGAQSSELIKSEQLIQSTVFGPVDRRPWWLRKHDTQSYVYGDTLASSEAGKDFAVNFTVPHDNYNATYGRRSKEISAILDFALHTKAPPYPRNVDMKLVTKGEGIYNARCARCHGALVSNSEGRQRWILKYRSMDYVGNNPLWKGKKLPEILYSTGRAHLGESPTDPEWTEDTDLTYSNALQLWGGTDPKTGRETEYSLTSKAFGLRVFFKNWGLSEEKLPAIYNPKQPGYRAPPLVGVWASAPYLHNGSVPTLRALFEYTPTKGVRKRPPVWARVYDTTPEGSYDFENVGLRVEYPEGWKMPLDDSLNSRRFYNAFLPGYSNKGARTCGPNLATKEDKDAVIELLKYLSDDTVKPEGTVSQWGKPL